MVRGAAPAGSGLAPGDRVDRPVRPRRLRRGWATAGPDATLPLPDRVSFAAGGGAAGQLPDRRVRLQAPRWAPAWARRCWSTAPPVESAPPPSRWPRQSGLGGSSASSRAGEGRDRHGGRGGRVGARRGLQGRAHALTEGQGRRHGDRPSGRGPFHRFATYLRGGPPARRGLRRAARSHGEGQPAPAQQRRRRRRLGRVRPVPPGLPRRSSGAGCCPTSVRRDRPTDRRDVRPRRCRRRAD